MRHRPGSKGVDQETHLLKCRAKTSPLDEPSVVGITRATLVLAGIPAIADPCMVQTLGANETASRLEEYTWVVFKHDTSAPVGVQETVGGVSETVKDNASERPTPHRDRVLGATLTRPLAMVRLLMHSDVFSVSGQSGTIRL